jgi:hypothetical protein
VLHRVPAAQAQRPLAVRQRIYTLGKDGLVLPAPVAEWMADDLAAGTPNAVTAGTRWGDSRSASTLAGLVAYQVVTGERPGTDPAVCGARGVLIAWLAGQASPASNTGLHLLAAVQDRNHDKGVFLAEAGSQSGIYLPHRELTLALTLLGRPASEVGARVSQAWDELTAANTSTERATEILGLPAPQQGSGVRCS